MRIFVDSDVLISSFLSRTGVAYLIVNNPKTDKFISNFSLEEIEAVFRKKNLDFGKLKMLIKQRFKVVIIEEKEVRSKTIFVLDSDDAHVIAGAIKSSTKFLISYNIKDYLVDKIRQDLNIIVMTPAQFLQYLRSR